VLEERVANISSIEVIANAVMLEVLNVVEVMLEVLNVVAVVVVVEIGFSVVVQFLNQVAVVVGVIAATMGIATFEIVFKISKGGKTEIQELKRHVVRCGQILVFKGYTLPNLHVSFLNVSFLAERLLN